MKKLLILVLAITVVLSVFSLSASADEQRVVNVSTPEELREALESDTKIILAPGRYVLESKTINEVYGDEVYTYVAPGELLIEDIENLTIEGNGQAELVLDVGSAPVVNIRTSSNITLSGLIMGHNVPEYGCGGEGHVVMANVVSDLYINNCDLYGCGVTAITAWQCKNIYATSSIFRDCMTNAICIEDFNGTAIFKNCIFRGNAYEDYSAQTTACIEWNNWTDMGGDGKMFFEGCSFENNLSTTFVSDYARENVTTTNCTFTNNAWQTAVNVKLYNGYGNSWQTYYFEDQRPVVVNGRTLVPLRGVLEGLGYTVEWDGATKSATISKYDKPYSVVVAIGSNIILKGTEQVVIDVPATTINNRTMVPIRAISEAFDIKVDWDAQTRSVLINPQA